MRAQDKVAALTAIIDGLGKALAEAKAETLAVAESVGVKGFTTPIGNVAVVSKKPTVQYDQAALLDWVEDEYPTEIVTVEQVRPAFMTHLASRLVVAGDSVIHTDTGEAVHFASVAPAGAPFVSWSASDEQKAAKRAAADWARREVEAIAFSFTNAAIEAGS